jgi:hypothetical protein
MDICVMCCKLRHKDKMQKNRDKERKYEWSTEYKRKEERNRVETRFSSPVQTGPGAHPASYTVGTRSLSRG